MMEFKQQLPIVGLKTQEEAEAEKAEKQRRRDRRALLRHRLMAAMRQHARDQLINRCSEELDADADTFFGVGEHKGVSASTLRACLEGTERNYFRLDWLFWFADECEEVAEILLEVAGHAKPKKTPEEELRELKELMRRELGATANRLIRKVEQ